uniref:GDT1 family protein n=1 Tax=Heterorhabditis bacteriophora TaxID=37862 RepID=A0A1I7WTL8_HETBA
MDISFYHGFLASLSVIIVSELGDKTWFIAVIMSMRHSRLTVFLGAMSALVLMTVLSAAVISGGVLGHAICTGIAVVGGKLVAQRISVRTGEFDLIIFRTIIVSF